MRVTRIAFIWPALVITLLAMEGKAQELKKVRISLQLHHVPLRQAMERIETLTPFKFFARAEDIENEGDITVDVKDQPLDKVLDQMLNQRNIQYRQVKSTIILKKEPAKNTGAMQVIPAAWKQPEKYTISGVVTLHGTGETVIGATILAHTGDASAASTISNEYGFYSMTLPPGAHQLTISAVGTTRKTIDLELRVNTVLNISLDKEITDLQAVTVNAVSLPGRSLKTPQMGVERLTMSEIKKIPVLLGEYDVLKTIQLLPGIKAAGDGNSGFYVRGGTSDQNLILLDEAPVYNPSHLFGFFSTFNSDAIKNIVVYKSGMPAQYGGRLSSVVDVKMNEGNLQDYNGSGSIGLIASRLDVEGPIKKDKASFLVSGRRTYIDLFMKQSSDTTINKSEMYFYDLNAKLNYKLSGTDRLYLSGYFGRDMLGLSGISGIDWGNATATARWNHLFSNRLFSNTSLIFSNYDFKITNKVAGNDFHITSRIKDWNVKEDLQWNANSANTVNIGVNSIYHTMKPGEITASHSSGINSIALPNRYSLENAAYATDTWKATDRLSLTYGVRVSAFSILGKGDFYNVDNTGRIIDTLHYSAGQVVKTYINAEPRVAAGYQLNSSTAIKVSYVRNTQNLHLISNSVSSSPTDRWVASTNIIKPEISDQVSLGYYKNLVLDNWELTIETYYKTMQHQIDYRDGADVYTNKPIETQLLFGKGRAYGIEWLLKKKMGRFTGWISYTLSKTERRIEGINNGQWYDTRQDRTHDIAIVGTYQLNKKWTLSADWVYYTGDAVTFPNAKYTTDGVVYFYYTKRNGYRMPAYHRLDLSATCQLQQKGRWSSELTFSLYNAYGRANAYRIFFRESKTDPNRTEAVQTTLFQFVPSISYNFKF